MAKYRILKPFKDKYTKKKYKANEEIEMTVKRATEAEKNLKKWGTGYLERVDNKEGD